MITKFISFASRIYHYLDINDLFVLLGLTMIFYGTYVVYPPAAFIITGGLLIWMGTRGINP